MIRFRAAEGATKHRTDRVWRLGMVSRTLRLGSAGLLVALALVGCSGNSAVASATTSLAPTPSRAAAPSATVAPRSPEVTPSPEMSLHDKLQAFLEGKLPISNNLFYVNNGANAPSPLGLVTNETIPVGKQYQLQGSLIGEEVVYDKNNQILNHFVCWLQRRGLLLRTFRCRKNIFKR